MENLIQTLAIYALPVVFAITLHEAAHGYVARYFGDSTAWQQGRVSFNPLRHIDPMGTVIVPAAILALSKLAGGGGLLFGWAKPVPVDFGRLRRPKQNMLWVAAAGPAANFFMACAWAVLLKLTMNAPEHDYSLPMKLMSEAGIQINLSLMVLNLLPLLPLDGGRIVFSLLPDRAAWRYGQSERWGLPILLILLASGVLGAIVALPIALLRILVAFLI